MAQQIEQPPKPDDVLDTKPEWLRKWRPAPPKSKPAAVITVKPSGNPNWQKGMASPNPAGRPPGVAQRKGRIMEKMLDEAGAVIDVMLQKALDGDAAAASLVVNRVLPVLRPQSEKVNFQLNCEAPVSKQVEQVLAAISSGEVAPDVGKKIIEAVQALGNVRAIEDLELRIRMLEAKAI